MLLLPAWGGLRPDSRDVVLCRDQLSYCDRQLHRTLRQLCAVGPLDYSLVPRNIAATDTTWALRRTSREEWCQGFWPGILWYDYECTGDTLMRHLADAYTRPLAFLAHTPAYDHDIGFLVMCSFGNGWRLTGRDDYKHVLLAAADTLATLYNPRVGTLLSWPREVRRFGGHCTIMDNMMNLELLFWASRHGGSPRLARIAEHHAATTMQHAFRPDGTCYHVCVYDTLTGRFLRGVTHQGYADGSTWARGQAWAVYGYTMVYRYVHRQDFLDQACRAADAYLQRLPADSVPYWDFDDPAIPHAPRDASAAAVTASALIELCTYVKGDRADRYLHAAEAMLRSLSSSAYLGGRDKPSFLVHSTGNYPAGSEIDAAINYADYYYIEALTRLKRLVDGRAVAE